MKKITISLIACLFALAAHAQNFGFGPRVGLNVSDLQGKDVKESSSRSSYHIGMFGEYRFNDVWACEAALMFSDQGAQMKWTDHNRLGPLEITSKMKLRYLNIPLLAKAYVFEGMNLFAGPQVGFLTGANAMGQNVSQLYKTAELSAVVGIGYQFDMGLNIVINYNIGLTDIAHDYTGTFKVNGWEQTEFHSTTMRNGVFQVSAGWRF